ncbi:MAG: protein kinase [Phycisphaerales bacterium]|nr:MAG: protein kinase [Phycisphaerales bacterium]
MSLAGKIFHPYHILELVGRGAMAEVYKAHHATLDCFVAVKVLYPHLAAQENFLGRFRQEARSIARLSHPNVVRIQDFRVEGDLVCMVMELIEGPSLRTCLDEALKLGVYWSLDDVLQLLQKVGSAVDYAHRQGIIHRDIKPENILLRTAKSSDEGTSGYTLAPAGASPVLMDFGLAYLLGEDRRSTIGSLSGTFAYMSPEQASGERGEQASDLYSLGVVLYEMITCRPPFVADMPSGMIFKHVYESPQPLRELRPDVPEAVEDVVLTALAKAPTDRYPTARALAEAFEVAITGKSLLSRISQPAREGIVYDVGDVIGGRYKVLKVLGEGQFSRVYKVWDDIVDEVRALKIVAASSVGLDSLRQEFQTLRVLDHPSITKVYDAGVLSNQCYYLKLEYVEGYTLRACIDRGMLTISKAVELVGDILEAISYLESRGYIHRDIKPSNIMVTPTGAKIIDFNVSKRLEDASMTQIGTPRYMPPEVPVFGWNRTGDIFSAGLAFYEMTTGSFPFPDPASYAAWEIPHPCEVNPALPLSLADIILKALSRDPSDRFQSAAEMLQAVRKASLGQKDWDDQTVLPRAVVRLSADSKSVRTQRLFSLEQLEPISASNIGRLSQLRCFGSGPPIAVGSMARWPGFAVVTTTGVEGVDPSDGSRRKVMGAQESAWVVAGISPQGKTLAVVDRTKNLLAYDLPTGRSLRRSINLPFAPGAVACSDSGRFVAIADRAGQKTFLLDIAKDRAVAEWPGLSGWVTFSPGQDLVAMCTGDEMVRLWQIDPGREIFRFDTVGDGVTRLAFNPDGQLLVTGGRTTRVWQTSAGRQMARWSMEPGSVTAVAFCPDSKWVALVTGDGRLELRDTATGRRRKEWKTGRASDLTVAPGGRTLHVIGGHVARGTSNVRSYDVRRGRQIEALAQNPGYQCASLSADGLYLAAGATDGSIFLWRTQEESSEQAWRKEKEPVWAVALAPDGRRLAVAMSGHVDLYNVERNQRLWQARVKEQNGYVAFSLDGRLLIVHQAGTVDLFDSATGKKVKRLRADLVTMASSGKAMAVVHRRQLRLFDPFTMRSSGRCPVPTCNNLALSSTACLLALLTTDDALEVWRIRGGRRLDVLLKVMLGLSGHGDRMNSLVFGRDGTLLASSGDDGIVRLWDSSVGGISKALMAHAGPVTSVSFSGDGRLLCSSGLDGTVSLWGCRTLR